MKWGGKSFWGGNALSSGRHLGAKIPPVLQAWATLIWLAALVGAVLSGSCLGKSFSRNDNFGAYCSNERTVRSFIAQYHPATIIQGAVTRRTCQVAISLIRLRLRGAASRHRSVFITNLDGVVPKWPTCDVMDWARDNSGLSDRDLDNVFKYEEKSTTVVRMLAGEKVGSRELSIKTYTHDLTATYNLVLGRER